MDLHQGKEQEIIRSSNVKMHWKMGNRWGDFETIDVLCMEVTRDILHSTVKKIYFHKITVHAIAEDIVQVAGDYDVISSSNGMVKRIAYEILVTYQADEILYLQLGTTKQESVIHKVRAVNEDCYSITEDEVLYIEANHNHVTWNCTDYIVIANDSLHRLEEELSERFVRIQRGYLVNKDYVKCIHRCEVIMENGDALPIPSKKYVSVKETLMS